MPGQTVLRTPHVRVVRVTRLNAEEEEVIQLRGCVFATNRKRTLAAVTQEEFTRASLRLDKHAGHWVSIRTSRSGRGGSSVSFDVVNVRSGRRYQLHRSVLMTGDPFPPQSLARYFLNDLGQVAAAFDVLGPGQGPSAPPVVTRTRIVAVNSRGAQRELDAGPPEELPASSLLLDRRLFVWTNRGAVRYALL